MVGALAVWQESRRPFSCEDRTSVLVANIVRISFVLEMGNFKRRESLLCLKVVSRDSIIAKLCACQLE